MCKKDRNHILLACNNPVSCAFEVLISLQFMDCLLVVAFWIFLYLYSLLSHEVYTLQFMKSCINCCNLNVKLDWIFLYLYSLISLVMCTVHAKLCSVLLNIVGYVSYTLCTVHAKLSPFLLNSQPKMRKTLYSTLILFPRICCSSFDSWNNYIASRALGYSQPLRVTNTVAKAWV
jgi:hypothetical protein